MIRIFGKSFGSISEGTGIDQRVSSVGQSGGITAHTVNINEAPAPEAKFGEIARTDNPNGSTTFQMPFEIVSPYPPAVLEIIAVGLGITEMEFQPTRAGMLQSGPQGFRDDCAFNSLISPSGRYFLVLTTTGEMPRIECSFG